jgi:hypothetical protein
MYQTPLSRISSSRSRKRSGQRECGEEMSMRVLVTGDRGYIGAVLVPFLRDSGHQVDGLDLGLY